MRLIDVIKDMIPHGLAWSYLWTFVRVFVHMLGGVIIFALLVFLGAMPFVAAFIYESVAHMFWYLITIPSMVVAIKFIAYNLRWDDEF